MAEVDLIKRCKNEVLNKVLMKRPDKEIPIKSPMKKVVHPRVSKTDPCEGGSQVHLAPGRGRGEGDDTKQG